ncbi:MAG: GGDEF domain-containing protein [Gammaproteobacteria bacterium]|nr:GGDEF domain-containing protein [Gammaproteobacteria bacterium]
METGPKTLCGSNSPSVRGGWSIVIITDGETQIIALKDVADSPNWAGGQQLRIAFENSILSLTVSVFCAFIIVSLFWPIADNRTLILWLGAISGITMLRLVMQQRFTQTDQTLDSYQGWHGYFVASAFASGCIWGVLPTFLFPADSILHQAYMTFILGGICASAVSVYSPLRGAFPAFAVPVLVPYALAVWTMGNSEGLLMAALVCAFLLILVRSARQSQKNIEDVLNLQVRNAGLTRALHYRATHDSLVDLVNHGEFNRRLEKLASENRREGNEYSLIFVDLDLFKEVNDEGGHAAGDLILKGIAEILVQYIRSSDTAARVGGDEFALLLDGCPQSRALEIAEEIRRDIADMQVEYEAGTYGISASIGVSYGRTGIDTAASMLKAADAACYSSKEGGRNRVCSNPAGRHFDTTDRFELTQKITSPPVAQY